LLGQTTLSSAANAAEKKTSYQTGLRPVPAEQKEILT